MDIEQVLRMYPNTVASDWHKHSNGGGWVYKTARVDDSVYLGPGARVYGNARVHGKARVHGDARVFGKMTRQVFQEAPDE